MGKINLCEIFIIIKIFSCVQTSNGPQIPKTNISSIFTLAQSALERKDPTLEVYLLLKDYGKASNKVQGDTFR